MARIEKDRGAARENAEVEKAYRQVTKTPSPARRPTPQQIASRKRAARNRKIAIISACSVALVLLICLIVGLIVSASRPKDDGLILDNVFAGGVNLGGMTKEEAKNALHLATDNTFSKKDMVIRLPDTTLTLSPSQTGAKLDVDAVVDAAYAYGRTGTEEEQKKIRENASSTTHTIALLDYLDLKLPYIQTAIQQMCDSYSSELIQPEISLVGDRPAYDPEHPDLPVTHQTLVIKMGSPDYGLDASDLYNQVLDAYSLNQWSVIYKTPALMEPKRPNAETLYREHCVDAKDASLDANYQPILEVYGYGFNKAALQKMIDEADYGQTIQIQLNFIMPSITAKDLLKDLFQDVLSSFTTKGSINSENWNTNLRLSCEAINNKVIEPGAEFSFNEIVGRPTAVKGYKEAFGYVDGQESTILGGGLSQTASALYQCALKADLDILKRHNNGYTVDFIGLGLDASINWGSHDLVFRNNTKAPIRIQAEAEGNTVHVQLWGTESREYRVEIVSKTVQQIDPEIEYKVMDKNNVLGYKDGDCFQSGITGYDVEVYIEKYHKQTGELVSSTLLDTSHYSKRNEIIVRTELDPPPEPDPIDPVDPMDPTTPSDPTVPTEPNTPDLSPL